MWGTAETALSLALDAIDGTGIDRLFLWVHLVDPHFDEYGFPPVYVPATGYEDLFGSNPRTDAREAALMDYDRKIRYLDDQLRDFFGVLANRGILDRFLVVIAVDHGEEFFEKGRWGHTKALTNTLVHVPLLIRLPDRQAAGVVSDDVVRNLDVMPTILDLLGIPPPPGAEGISLRPAWEGGNLPHLLAYGESLRGGRNMRYLIDPERGLKLIVDVKRKTRELFALTDDAEQNDLTGRQSGQADAMQQRLFQMIAGMERRAISKRSNVEMSDEEKERLRRLGYMGK
jgi:arylsulfatase A-like enzyme